MRIVLGGGGSASSGTVPNAPVIGALTAGNGSVTISYSPPANDGGSPITSYTAYVSPGGATKVDSGSPTTITGLTNGTAYQVQVKATNANGDSAWSAWSNSATPAAGASVPGAPTGVAATAGNASATVTWTAPSNGGSPITSYDVKCSNGVVKSASGSGFVFGGLTNGLNYTFQVRANNAIGAGPYSSNSNSVTPFPPRATVSAPNILVGVVQPSNPSGSSHATVTGGVGPFTYSWTWAGGGAGITLSGASTSTVSASSTTLGTRTGTLLCSVTDTGNGNAISTTTISVSLTKDSGA